jgi:hypothetical protein
LGGVSTRSAGGAPAGAISELGLPARAVTALTRAGVTSTADLAVLTRRELTAVPGLGAGMIAAIRAVVPEPGRDGAVPPAPAPDTGEAEEESPAAPAIPSFASLRAPQRRTAMDLLVPGLPAEPPAGTPPTPPGPPPAPGAPEPPRAPRPAEYGDLLRIGAHLARAAAGLPVRVVRWSLAEPVRVLRRLLG